MKILNYVELIVRFDRTELYTKKHKNNQKIRKSTVRRDKIELVRLSSVRFETLLKFHCIKIKIKLTIFSFIQFNIY